VLSTTLASMLGGLVRCGHGGMQGGELAHHTLVGVLLVSMDCLGMLAQIVETRELLSTMAGERTFASVLPVERMMSESGTEEERREERARNTDLMCLAKCSLLLKTMRQSP
jgi:hypothetical protein